MLPTLLLLVAALVALAAWGEAAYRLGDTRRALTRVRELAGHDLTAAAAVHARAVRRARLVRRWLSAADRELLELGPTAVLEPQRAAPRFGTRYGPTVRELAAGDPLDRIGTARIRPVRDVSGRV